VFYFSRPKGGLMVGKGLLRPPAVCRVKADSPIKILFVSDMHLRAGSWKTAENVYSLIESEKPETVIFGGDFAENDVSFLAFFDGLRKYSCPFGMFAVEGNNEYGRLKKDREKIASVMKEGGVTLLRGECARIETPKGAIEIAGVWDSFINPDAGAKGIFSEDDKAYRILLAHEPLRKYLDEIGMDADLMLSGHTHGGQVNVLGFTRYELLNYESNYRFTHIADVKKFGKCTSIVSRGIGTSKFNIRFGARSEVYVIE